jgi:NAD+ kinase
MKINVIYNKNILNYDKYLNELTTLLSKKNIEFRQFDIDFMENFGDFSVVIGGDGTLLKAAKYYSNFQVPTLGINLGRLGFLSQNLTPNDVIENLFKKNYIIDERMAIFSEDNIALNDFVIKGCDCSRTSKFHLEINGVEVCDYIADGLIISTPTGTTAYGLSAGGPVLHPSMRAITIVPICPHTLTARPLVVPSSEIITVRTGDKPLSVAVDGVYCAKSVDSIQIQSSKQNILLAFLENERFYSVLRNKLHWGISPER